MTYEVLVIACGDQDFSVSRLIDGPRPKVGVGLRLTRWVRLGENPDRSVLATRATAKQKVIRHIEGFSNRRCLHSALGYRLPLEALTEHYSHPRAAWLRPQADCPENPGCPSPAMPL